MKDKKECFVQGHSFFSSGEKKEGVGHEKVLECVMAWKWKNEALSLADDPDDACRFGLYCLGGKRGRNEIWVCCNDSFCL